MTATVLKLKCAACDDVGCVITDYSFRGNVLIPIVSLCPECNPVGQKEIKIKTLQPGDDT